MMDSKRSFCDKSIFSDNACRGNHVRWVKGDAIRQLGCKIHAESMVLQNFHFIIAIRAGVALSIVLNE